MRKQKKLFDQWTENNPHLVQKGNDRKLPCSDGMARTLIFLELHFSSMNPGCISFPGLRFGE